MCVAEVPVGQGHAEGAELAGKYSSTLTYKADGSLASETYATAGATPGGRRQPLLQRPRTAAAHLGQGYKGSKSFTRREALEFVQLGQEQAAIACQMTPIPDIVDRAGRDGEACGWLAIGLIPRTKVLMADGTTKSIENIKVSDQILGHRPGLRRDRAANGGGDGHHAGAKGPRQADR